VGYDLNAFVGLMNGNLMSARRYQYDEENRLTAVTEIDGMPLLTIEYDALGRRPLDTAGAAQQCGPLRGHRASPGRRRQGRIASAEYNVATDPCTGDPGPVTVQTRHIYSGLTLDTAGAAERRGPLRGLRTSSERPRQGLTAGYPV
jgi:hypothetical protein